jgi:hypothetical protein
VFVSSNPHGSLTFSHPSIPLLQTSIPLRSSPFIPPSTTTGASFGIAGPSSLNPGTASEFGTALDWNNNYELLGVGATRYGDTKQGAVFVYNATSYELVWSLVGEENEQIGGQFSMSNSKIAVARQDSIEIRNAYTGALIGNAVPSEKSNDVSLVNDQLLIIGEDRFDTLSGRVRILNYNNDQWDDMKSISSSFPEGRFGWVVSANADGYRVAISAPNADRDSDRQGYVTILERDDATGSWSQLGDSLFGTAASGQFGFSMAMSGDGTFLIIGSQGKIDGALSVFRFAEGAWEQVGTTLHSKEVGERFGRLVAISHDGARIAATSFLFDKERGHARIFDLIEGDWSPLQEVEGDSIGDRFGFGLNGLDLSSDGSVLTVGAVFALDGTGEVKLVNLKASPEEEANASASPTEILFLESTLTPSVSPTANEPTTSVDVAPTQSPTTNTVSPSTAPSNESSAPSVISFGSGAPTARTTPSPSVGTDASSQTPSVAPSDTTGITLPSVTNNTVTINASSSLGFEGRHEFGSLVDYNRNRALLAVGAPKFGNMKQGSVSVYDGETYDLVWSTTGDEMNEAVGSRVSLSDTKIAIGRRDYIEIRNAYTGELSGGPIPVEKGKDVVLVNDDLLIVSEDGFNDRTGRVRILSRNRVNDQWNGVLSIPGLFSEGRFGWVVSASADGFRVAISAPNAERDSYHQGYVTVLERGSIDCSWSQLGDSLFGTAASGQFGFSLAISGDGSTLVVGSQGMIDGAVAAFRFGEGIWKQVGTTMHSKGVGERFGRSAAISYDGTRIAATSFLFDEDRGHARIFDLVGDEWSPVHEVEGSSIGDKLGLGLNGLDLSPDGSTLTVGAVSAFNGAGQVKIVSLQGVSEDIGILAPSVSPDTSSTLPNENPTLSPPTSANPAPTPTRPPTAPPTSTPKIPPIAPPTPGPTNPSTPAPTKPPTLAPTVAPTPPPTSASPTPEPTFPPTPVPTSPRTPVPFPTFSSLPTIYLNTVAPASPTVSPAVDSPTPDPSGSPSLSPSTSSTAPTKPNTPSTTPSLRGPSMEPPSAMMEESNSTNDELSSVVSISSSTRMTGSLMVLTSTVVMLSLVVAF